MLIEFIHTTASSFMDVWFFPFHLFFQLQDCKNENQILKQRPKAAQQINKEMETPNKVISG